MDGIKPQNDIAGLKLDGQLRSAEKLAGGTKDKKQSEKAATDFEALMLHQMLNEMWKTVPKDTLLGGSSEEAQYRDMYTEALSKNIAEKSSIGVKSVLMKEFDKATEKKTLKVG